jgi:phosphoglycerol transferase MdoB-like AlkP superfamily enzyme
VPDLFLIALVIGALAKSVLSRGIALGWSVSAAGVWLDAALVVVLVGVMAILFRRRNQYLMLGAYVFLSIVLFADALYASFFQTMLDPQMFRLAGQAGEISDIIVSLLRPIYLLFFIDIPLLMWWAMALRKRHLIYPRKGPAIAAAVAVVVLVVQLLVVGSVPEGTDSATIASQYGMTSMQLSSLGSMMFPKEHTSAFAAVAAKSRTTPPANNKDGKPSAPQESEAVRLFNSKMGKYAPVGGTRIAPFKEGAFKGKNVIIVQFESLQDMFIDEKINGQYVTPNVNKFVDDCWYFPNTYSQTGIGNTADNEFTLATSMLPPLKQNATGAYANRELPALPRLLDDQGYRTITLHTNSAKFWFRTDLYTSLGYQKWYDKAYFKDRDVMWRGSSDEVFWEDGFKAYKAELKKDKPVMATFITMTSHLEYNFPPYYRRPLKLPSDTQYSYAGKYASSISYADKAFGQFIADLKDAGLYDDSVIVLFGDHMGYKTDEPAAADDKIISQLLGRDFSYVDHQRVAFAIHVPGQKPRVVKSMRAAQDYMPTIADMLGVDLSSTPHFGRSAFVEGPRLAAMRAYFPGGSYVDNDIVFVAGATASEDKAYSIQTNKQVEAPSRFDSAFDMVRQFNALSNDWLMAQPKRAGAVDRNNSTKDQQPQE